MVRSWVVPFEKVPVAVNCVVVPRAMLGLVGATSIETSVAAVTVSVVLPAIEPEVAVILAVPTPVEAARPVPLTVATTVEEVLQTTDVLRS